MDFAMGWNRFNLTVLGVWPEPSETTRCWRIISTIIFWSSAFITFSFICAPQTAHLILKSTSLDEVIENLSINVPIAFALIKQLILRYHGKALTTLLADMLHDWSKISIEIERETMMKKAKISRMISIVCSTLTYLMLLAFLSLQIYSDAQNTSEANLDGLLHPATFPYDVQKNVNFVITWSGQFMGTILTAICYSCFDTFLAVLVLHLCGQLMILQSNLKNLARVTLSDDAAFRRRLGFIVNRHQHLYRYSVIVENCFNFTLLVQTLISTAMFCLTGYRLITLIDQKEEDLPVVGLAFFVIHVIYTMLHLYIYCYIGEALLMESTGMAYSTYDTEWYELPPHKAVQLITVICRSRIAFQITAGKFSPFSLELFGTIMKTSASYLSVLLAMKE